MIHTQLRGSNVVEKLMSNELENFDDDFVVCVPRSVVSYEIVKLQRLNMRTEESDKKLMLLINAFYLQAKERASKRRFIKMKVEVVKVCFDDAIVPVYLCV